jgi:hypothetical protein
MHDNIIKLSSPWMGFTYKFLASFVYGVSNVNNYVSWMDIILIGYLLNIWVEW